MPPSPPPNDAQECRGRRGRGRRRNINRHTTTLSTTLSDPILFGQLLDKRIPNSLSLLPSLGDVRAGPSIELADYDPPSPPREQASSRFCIPLLGRLLVILGEIDSDHCTVAETTFLLSRFVDARERLVFCSLRGPPSRAALSFERRPTATGPTEKRGRIGPDHFTRLFALRPRTGEERLQGELERRGRTIRSGEGDEV